LLRPLLLALIFSFIFGRVAGLPSGGVPYAVLSLSGLLVWQFFSDSFMHGSMAFLNNVELVTKVYFPRIIIPASILLCSTLDFLIFFSFLLFAFWAFWGICFSLKILFIPLFFAWLFIFVLSVNILFSSLIVKYRDFKHLVPFVIQLGMYVTPVGYSSLIFKTKWRYILSLNPLSSIIDCFRWSILGQGVFVHGIIISSIVTVLLFIGGLYYLKKTEQYFADVI